MVITHDIPFRSTLILTTKAVCPRLLPLQLLPLHLHLMLVLLVQWIAAPSSAAGSGRG
jgi:hypothetical protein